MKRLLVFFSMSLLAMPLAAHAQPVKGPYVSVGAGVNSMQQEDVDVKLGTMDVTGEVLTSPGPALTGAFGWALRNGLRLEVEGDFRSNHIKGESGLSGEDLGTGTERKYGVMVNALYDFGSKVRPYVGGGIGGQFVHEPDAASTSGGVTVSVNGGTQGSFAFQVIAGVAFPVNTHFAVIADYRFLDLVGTRTYTGTANVPGLGSFDLTDNSSNDNNHTVVFGFRYSFGS